MKNKLFKVSLLVLSLILLTSCDLFTKKPTNGGDDPNPDDPPIVVPTTAYIDESKPVAYVKEADNYDLIAMMNAAGLSSGQPEPFKYETPLGLPVVPYNKALVNEDIVVNLDSADARNVENHLHQMYMDNYVIRTNAKNNLAINEPYFYWYTMLLVDTFQTDEVASFTTLYYYFAYPGSGGSAINSYAFRVSDGKLLTTEEVLGAIGTDLASVKAYIRNDFASGTYDYYGTNVTRNLEEHVEVPPSILDNNLYFRIKAENAITVTDTDIYVVLEMFLEYNYLFDIPTVYKIPISGL